MPDDRTAATELGTALGTLPFPDLQTAVAARPACVHVDAGTWDRLDRVLASGLHEDALATAFTNGRAFLAAADGLGGRTPRTVEWTGGRRPPGDEVAPIDLRIDHVYLISCKYDSDILANPSPARLFDGLLATTGSWGRDDWYGVVAPDEHLELYRACLSATGLDGHPDRPGGRTREQVDVLKAALPGRKPYPGARARSAYAALCRAVSTASAARWTASMAGSGVPPETMLWRLLRIGSAPYFILGHDRRTGGAARFRVADPWDWRQHFTLTEFAVAPSAAGQPRVDWTCTWRARHGDEGGTVCGHVEIRWSHGRFAQPPEAKVYLDTPMEQLPGYHRLEPAAAEPQLALWPVGP